MSDFTNQNAKENVNGSGNAGSSLNQNPGQVVMPAPERHQTVTYVDSVNVTGRYTSNEYTAPVQPVQPIQFSQQPQPVQQTVQPVQPVQQTVQPVQPVQQTVQPVQPVQPIRQPVQPIQQTAQPAQPVQPIQQPVQPVSTAATGANPTPIASSVTSAPYIAQTQRRPMPEAAPAPFSVAAASQANPTTATSPRPQTAAQPQSSAQNQSSASGSTLQNSEAENETKGKKEKKGPNFFVKLLMAAAMGLVFGLIAGGVILLMVKFIPNNLQNVGKPLASEVITSENPTEGTGSETSSEISSEGEVLVVGDNNGIGTTEVTADMTVPEVARECMPAVVIINTLVDYNYYGMVQEVPASGTGVIVGMNEEDLFIATNYHVVEGAKEIKVQFCDASTANAEVKGKKVAMDLAVITIDISSLGQKTKDAIKFAKVGNSDNLVVGESCVAIGNALGYGQSVTYGVISALDREITTEKGETGHFIQTDAAINPGNSGGALLNMRGELIGINSNKLGGTVVEGMGYAIPINTARPIIQNLIEKKELKELPEEEQSYFGISGATVKSGLTTNNGVIIPEGIYVTNVVPGSPADKAGIQKGDIITEFEGESVVSTSELMQFLASYPSGAKVTVTYRRLENNSFVTHEAQVTLEGKSTK